MLAPRATALLLASLAALPAPAADEPACSLTAVLWSGDPAPGSVTITHSGTASFQVSTEQSKLILKLEACRDATQGKKIPGQGTLLREVRWAQHADDVVWVVIELARMPRYTVHRSEGRIAVQLEADEPAAEPRFEAEYGALPEAMRRAMTPSAWREGCPVGLADLALVRVSYWGFDGAAHQGELVVHQKLAVEVLAIFGELFEARFPIDKMRRIELYDGDDGKSMADNNTSAFNCRNILGRKNKFSNHAFGMAIDINPVQNPYVKQGAVEPEQGREFLERARPRPGMVRKDDACHQAFVKRGWTWGGAWRSLKDYQHFEKRLK